MSDNERYVCPSCRAVFRTHFVCCPIDGEPVRELTSDPLEGSTFADRYVIEGLVGEGATGRVYQARHQRVSRRFAIKVLYGEHAVDPAMRGRFAREAEAASRLDHPNVISVLDFGEVDSLLYLAMDFVEGIELDELIAGETPMAAGRVENLLRQLCRGLDHAHSKNLVHRDFKAANVVVSQIHGQETARIVDFGLAVMSEQIDANRITTDGVVCGTPMYMSPEQAAGVEVDHLTDLFALGVLLYEMLAGVGPFDGSPLEVLRKNTASPIPPIAVRVPGLKVDSHLEAIAHKLMSKERADRYQSAAEVIAALDGARSHAEPVAAGRQGLEADETAKIQKRRPRAGYWLAATLVLLIAGASAIGWRAFASAAPAIVADEIEPVVAAEAIEPVVAAEVIEPAAAAAPVDAGAPDATREVTRAAGRSGDQPTRPPDGEPEGSKDRAEKRAPDERRQSAETRAAPFAPETLTELYLRVNRKITAHARQHGTVAARPYWAAYEAIVITDALRNPALRAQYTRKLRALERRLDAAVQMQP